MTDVKYRPDEWERAKKALEELSESSGWPFNSKNKIIGYIEDIHENMEEAGNDIRKLDSDGVISFNYEDTTGKFRELLEDFAVLQDFTDKVGDVVNRAIDQSFYKDMDAFATAMRNLSIENYTTKNTIGATEVKVTYTGGYGAHAYKTTERKKDTINMIDILNGNNFYAAKIKVDYDRFKQEHPDEKFSFEDYQHAALNTRAFQYESIEDNQKKKEFWRDIIIGIGLVVGTVAAIACPPAAPAIIALGASYGTLELSSAVSGKDWMTGRELDTGERWLRGAFSLLDIVPGVKGIHAFTKAARGVPEAILKVANQSSTNLKNAVKQGAATVQGMLDTAAMKALGRIRAVKESARESARIALKRAEPGMIKTAQKSDELLTSLKNIKLPIREPVPVEGAIPAAQNTHRVENFMKSMINKLEDKLSPPPRNGVGGVEVAGESLKEQIRKRVLENIETSKTVREASNYGVYLRKEKELLAKIEKKALEGSLKYKEGYYVEHLTGEVIKCTDWKGVSGGHNYEEFKKFFDKNGKYRYKEIGRREHPDIPGIYDIEYRLKVEVKNYQGKGTGEYKVVPKEDKPPHKKTIYDPNVISNDDIVRLGKEAMEEGIKSQRVSQLKSQTNKQIIRGVSSNGLKFEGIKNIDTGEIENFYPVFKFGEK